MNLEKLANKAETKKKLKFEKDNPKTDYYIKDQVIINEEKRMTNAELLKAAENGDLQKVEDA
jgi:hypothetical protein